MTDGHAVTVLAAKDEIRDLLARYCRAIDRLDEELLATVYHPDAVDAHGLLGVDGSASAFRSAVFPLLSGSWESTQHVLGSSLIEVDEDVADGETYVIAYHVRSPDANGVQVLDVTGCRYIDRFERREGTWRIFRRLVVQDWQESRPINPGVGPTHESGRRDRHDAVYRSIR